MSLEVDQFEEIIRGFQGQRPQGDGRSGYR